MSIHPLLRPHTLIPGSASADTIAYGEAINLRRTGDAEAVYRLQINFGFTRNSLFRILGAIAQAQPSNGFGDQRVVYPRSVRNRKTEAQICALYQ